jgi:heparan-alpha-glucosaminide N-acetyltransferase
MLTIFNLYCVSYCPEMSKTSPLKIQPQLCNVLTTQRVYTIDALRGITILVMIFVNELAGVSGISPGWKHAPAAADTMTFPDIVFPSFLFIVGMSIPFAISNRISKGDSYPQLIKHILFRSAGLLVLGVFMVNTEGGYNHEAMILPVSLWALLFAVFAIMVWNSYPQPQKGRILRIAGAAGLVVLALLYIREDGSRGITPQWWGILGLIGWAYLIASLTYLFGKGSLMVIGSALVLCVAWFAFGSVDIAPKNSFLSFMNAQKGHSTHSSIVLAGVIITLLMFDDRVNRTLAVRLMYVAGFAVASCVAGFVLRQWFPVSKIFATPSWAFFCVAICIAVFLFLYWLIDVKKFSGWTSFVRPAASNPLLTYLIPFIIFAFMSLLSLRWPETFHHGIAGMIWSLVYAVSVMAFVILLNRLNIKLRL